MVVAEITRSHRAGPAHSSRVIRHNDVRLAARLSPLTWGVFLALAWGQSRQRRDCCRCQCARPPTATHCQQRQRYAPGKYPVTECRWGIQQSLQPV
ncbi:hypothetical protein ACM3CU_06535 [Edwardsiella ictaluri]|uniref:hypothetical protein n=1 Tax=Edwardsiella ictaluri TaxID=67780 RepID=UPI0039F71836